MGSPYEKHCSVCGKLFYAGDAENWVYKQQRGYGKTHEWLWFCSWHCMRYEEKEHEREKQKRREMYAKRKAVHKKRMD